MALVWVKLRDDASTNPGYRVPYNVTVPELEGHVWTGRVKLVVLSNSWVAPGPYSQYLWFLENFEAASGWPPPGEYITTRTLDPVFGGVVYGQIGYGYPDTMLGTAVFECYAEADYDPPPPPPFWQDFIGCKEITP